MTKVNIVKKLKSVRNAALKLRNSSAEGKNQVLISIATALEENSAALLKANHRDLFKVDKKTSSAFMDRLTLNGSRLGLMAESLRQVAKLEDPLSERESKTLSNGLVLKKVRAPLGVIFMIFESRPNVATEAFGLAFKAGNSII